MKQALLSLIVAMEYRNSQEIYNAIEYAKQLIIDDYNFCSQCGQKYSDRACGPTHAVISRSLFVKVVS